MKSKNFSNLPYFKITLSITIIYLILVIIIPFSTLFGQLSNLTFDDGIRIITDSRVIHSFRLSIISSIIATSISTIFGIIIAWSLVRYKFGGRKIFDALIDMPIALPTAVSGVALAELYNKQGFIGSFFTKYGIKIAFTPNAIIIALIFVSLPYIVRSIQPILISLNPEIEEVALTLGAKRNHIFSKIILPTIAPGIISGIMISFARCLGEYGAIIFIAGNIPYYSEILPLLIYINVEQCNYETASLLAICILLITFSFLLLFHFLSKRLYGHSKK